MNQAPTPVAAPATAPEGIQYGGQGEITRGNSDAVVDKTVDQTKLVVNKPNAPSSATNTSGTSGGADNISTSETQQTSFDKLKKVSRKPGGAFGTSATGA